MYRFTSSPRDFRDYSVEDFINYTVHKISKWLCKLVKCLCSWLATLKICCANWWLELTELYIKMYSCKKKLCLKNLKEHYALYVDNAI